MGEDVGLIGGIFGATRGLREAFGEERVRDTPISEPTFVGMGVGAAVSGLRPIVELQIFDFVAMTMDQIVNQAAKFRYMLGGTPTVPLVIRGPQGGGIRLAAQHSQSLEAWFIHVPGLVVVAPSTPADAKGLLTSAIRDDNPVVVHEAVRRGGFGAEVAALVSEKALDWLDAPIVRVGARHVPMPYNDALERATIPTQEDIAAAVRSLV